MKRLVLLSLCCTRLLAAGDLVRNGDFAAGLANWDPYGAAARAVFTTVKTDGVTALRYGKTGTHPADNYHLDQTLAAQPETLYRVSVRYRSSVLSPVIAVATAKWEQFKIVALPPSAAWREYSFAFHSGAETELKLQLFAGAQGKTREAFDGESFFTAIRSEVVAPNVTLEASAGTHSIPETFTGVNTLFWLETPEDLADGAIPSQVAEARFGVLRYPAGTAGQNYDWRRNTVVNPQKYPGPPKSGESYLDTDGFIALAQRAHARPFIVLNLASIFHFTANPSDADFQAMYRAAADWAAHFKQAGIRVACYELGNEHYLKEESSPYVMMTAQQYADIGRHVIAAIRAVDPDAVFGAVGPSRFSTVGGLDLASGHPEPWWPTVLAAIGDQIANVIIHHYWAGSDYYSLALDYGEEIDAFREALGAWQQANGGRRPLRIGYTEWGGKNYPDAAAYALFVHEALASFAAHRVDYAIAWPHRRWSQSPEWAQSQILDDRTPRPAHAVFAAWGAGMNGGTFVPFSAESLLPPQLFGAAARNEDQLTVLLGNKSAVDQTLRLIVRGPYTRAAYGTLGGAPAVTADFRNEMTLTINARSVLAVHLTMPGAEPRLTRQPASRTVTAGQTVTFTAAAASTLPVTYQWIHDGASLRGATAAELALSDVRPGDAGAYTVVVTTAAGSVASAAATLTVVPFNGGRISNLSILTRLTEASPRCTMGTVVGGAGTSGPKALLVRAAGPSLTPLGVAAALADPQIEMYSAGTYAIANDNWGGAAALSAAFAAVGAFPFSAPDSRDAAVFHPALAAGSHTVQVSDRAGATGTVLAELYDSTPPQQFALSTPRLINASVLREIGRDEILTAGFVISGATKRWVLIRAIGPTLALAPFLVAGAMTDPKLELFHGPDVIGSNDNWGGAAALATASLSVGAFAVGSAASRDAMLLVPLDPGSYTVQASGVAGANGLTLIEIYEAP